MQTNPAIEQNLKNVLNGQRICGVSQVFEEEVCGRKDLPKS